MVVNKLDVSQGDAKIRHHLPNHISQGPLALAQECMELSNKIQVLTDDYLFCTIFMEYIKIKDPELYKQGKLIAESTLRIDKDVKNA
tara:strand:+ start:96 stop:356 length:261 start_codon:yes stop_codon:yes gene_type:complete